MEMRKNKRYQLRAPVKFSWKHFASRAFHCQGCTSDISSGGVFVATQEFLTVGSLVEMEISLPEVRARLRTTGRVVRLNDRGFGAVAQTSFRMLYTQLLRNSAEGGELRFRRHAAAVVLN